jgi:hypothetical protein
VLSVLKDSIPYNISEPQVSVYPYAIYNSVCNTVSRMAVGPTQPPIQWVRGSLSLGQSGRGVKLTTHLHLVPRSRMRGSIPPLSQYVFMAWCLVKHRYNFYTERFSDRLGPASHWAVKTRARDKTRAPGSRRYV